MAVRTPCGSVFLVGQIQPDITVTNIEVTCDLKEDHTGAHHGVFSETVVTWRHTTPEERLLRAIFFGDDDD